MWIAIGYALANSMMLEAPDGLVIVDTTESIESGAEIYTAFRRIQPHKRVTAIMYTHNHADHTFGAQVSITTD